MIEQYLDKVDAVEGNEEFQEYDYLQIDLSDYPFDGSETDYELDDMDKDRPYLVPYKFYGSQYVKLQDILFLINNYGDLLNLSGDVKIKVPLLPKLLNYLRGKENV